MMEEANLHTHTLNLCAKYTCMLNTLPHIHINAHILYKYVYMMFCSLG